jgi:hypothetical protein
MFRLVAGLPTAFDSFAARAAGEFTADSSTAIAEAFETSITIDNVVAQFPTRDLQYVCRSLIG